MYSFFCNLGNQYTINSSDSLSFKPSTANFSSKNWIVWFPFTTKPSLRLHFSLRIPSQYKAYRPLPVSISTNVPSGFASTFQPFLYSGYEHVILFSFPNLTDNCISFSGYKYIIGLS